MCADSKCICVPKESGIRNTLEMVSSIEIMKNMKLILFVQNQWPLFSNFLYERCVSNCSSIAVFQFACLSTFFAVFLFRIGMQGENCRGFLLCSVSTLQPLLCCSKVMVSNAKVIVNIPNRNKWLFFRRKYRNKNHFKLYAAKQCRSYIQKPFNTFLILFASLFSS